MKNKNNHTVHILSAGKNHIDYVDQICQMIESATKIRGTGIAKRSPEYLENKILDGKAVIAVSGNELAGFCYIETWGHGQYTANSGLIVHPDFQGMGLGRKIKEATFNLARKKYPEAKVFGITTSLAVMKINSSLGYEPVTFSELTDDENFWKGCSGCVNYDILNRTNHHHCLCTGMLFDPNKKNGRIKKTSSDRWNRFKLFVKKYKTIYKNGKEKGISKLSKVENEPIDQKELKEKGNSK